MPTARGMEPKATTQHPLSITPTLALATRITKCLTPSQSHRIQHLVTIQVNLPTIHLRCLFCKYDTYPNLFGSVLFSEQHHNSSDNVQYWSMQSPTKCFMTTSPVDHVKFWIYLSEPRAISKSNTPLIQELPVDGPNLTTDTDWLVTLEPDIRQKPGYTASVSLMALQDCQ
jgi:hypothetical protein